ncbi:hypothetical protein C8T65DRAFT_591318 [Cerioporus squamosus]|nr:hypothetical protein C8T65DRAFT_591318 [Cerioporus squamosus]
MITLLAADAFLCEEASNQLAAAHEQTNGKFRCLQCLLVMDRRGARNHVGHHLLRSLRHIPETLLGISVGKSMPCGFCGRSGITSCQQLFLTSGKNPQAKSGCLYAHTFQYRPSLVSKLGGMVCTNTPILCSIPGCTRCTGNYLSAIWKYNMEEHLRLEHPGYSWDGFHPGTIVPDLLSAMHITREEEEAMKIPAEAILQLKYGDYMKAHQGNVATSSNSVSSTMAPSPVSVAGPATPVQTLATKRLLDNDITSSLKCARR